jgi:3-deoxy-D-manno-octulosonic acid kinase
MIDEQFIATSRGGILYDASRLRKPGDELFEREHWSAQGGLHEVSGGRGSIAILQTGAQRWVLRHYRRGGWIARISRDRYWWRSADRTRSFAEWRLLAELKRRGLPVPAPIAARYQRSLFTYSADLITEHLPPSRTLADSLTGAALSQDRWHTIGTTLAKFHAQGVHHADLNAHNILLSDTPPTIYLLDFDRGQLRPRGPWETTVLQRLHRSLNKIKTQRPDVRFAAEQEWRWLMEGYEAS